MKTVVEIDGDAFDTLDGFFAHFGARAGCAAWGKNLDAFNDVLRGGFGTPEGGFVLRWRSAERSRHLLGRSFDVLVEILREHGAGGAEAEDGIELALD